MPNADQQNISRTASTYTHTDSISEQTIVTFTPSQYSFFKGIFLDLSNITKSATLRMKQDINNAGSYITFETLSFVPSISNPGALFSRDFPADGPIRATLQSSELEGTTRSVPYEYFYTDLGAAPTS